MDKICTEIVYNWGVKFRNWQCTNSMQCVIVTCCCVSGAIGVSALWWAVWSLSLRPLVVGLISLVVSGCFGCLAYILDKHLLVEPTRETLQPLMQQQLDTVRVHRDVATEIVSYML